MALTPIATQEKTIYAAYTNDEGKREEITLTGSGCGYTIEGGGTLIKVWNNQTFEKMTTIFPVSRLLVLRQTNVG